MINVLVVVLFILCESCYTGQSFFSKLYSDSYEGPKIAATPAFTLLYGAIVCVITFALNGFTISASWPTIIYGVINGVILFLYYLGMIKAAERGPYSFQSILMLMGCIVVCIIVNRLLWNVSISLMQYIGIFIMLISFVVLNFGGLDLSNVKKGYYFWTFSLFFTNGIFGVLLDAQQREFHDEKNEMIFFTFLSCSIFSIIYLYIVQKGNVKEAFQMGKRAWIYAILSSTCAGFAIFLLMVLLGYIPSYILYTLDNGTILISSQILCVAVLKEKMTRQAIFGIILATISIVILSL